MKSHEFLIEKIKRLEEGWSQKYKSSINCSHPKGFSQRAHCAGKKKHNESVVMEMVCKDCGMCETHGDHSKDKLDELKCWSGYHRVAGTKEGFPGSCAKNKTNEESVAEGRGRPFRGVGGAFNRGDDERHDLDPTDWYFVKDGKMFAISIYPNQEREATARGYSRTRAEAKAKASEQGVAEGSLEEIDRRGFLKGLGAAAVAGAAGSAMAQSRPVDVSREFQNMRQDDPRVQHNKDIEEMTRAIYDQIVATRGQPIDRRQQQMWMTIAREKATEKLSKYTPGRSAPQSQSSGFPAQGSERRVSRNIDNFESQGVAEGFNGEYDDLADQVYAEFERMYPNMARRADDRVIHNAIMSVLNYGGDNDPGALAGDVARAVKQQMQSGVEEGVTESAYSLEQAHAIFDDFEQAMADRGLTEDIFNFFTDEEIILETAAWRRSAGKSKKGGLNAKGVASYRRENPGSKLQMAVTTKPSKLKPGSKAAKRRKSFCARMGGVKGPMKKPNGKPTRKALALRKWNC